MRKISFADGEFYHVFNRGMHKRDIFRHDRDRQRFLFSLLYFQSPRTFDNISELMPYFLQHRMLKDKALTPEIVKRRFVSLLAFTLMSNHFHLLIQAHTDSGVSSYLQRAQNSYTKYFNARYEESGHLFQGPFRAIHIRDNEQLLYASAYIHRNCCEIKKWESRPADYPWSSYQDYVQKNRWPDLLLTNEIQEQFDSPTDYFAWVEETEAKANPATSDVEEMLA